MNVTDRTSPDDKVHGVNCPVARGPAIYTSFKSSSQDYKHSADMCDGDRAGVRRVGGVCFRLFRLFVAPRWAVGSLVGLAG